MVIDLKKTPTGTLVRQFNLFLKDDNGRIHEPATMKYYEEVEAELNSRFRQFDEVRGIIDRIKPQ